MMLTTMPTNTKDNEPVLAFPSEEISTTPDEITQANQVPEELSDEELEAVAAGFMLAILKRMSRVARSGFGPAVNLVAAIKQIGIVSFAKRLFEKYVLLSCRTQRSPVRHLSTWPGPSFFAPLRSAQNGIFIPS